MTLMPGEPSDETNRDCVEGRSFAALLWGKRATNPDGFVNSFRRSGSGGFWTRYGTDGSKSRSGGASKIAMSLIAGPLP